jgi:hypothetical protein
LAESARCVLQLGTSSSDKFLMEIQSISRAEFMSHSSLYFYEPYTASIA